MRNFAAGTLITLGSLLAGATALGQAAGEPAAEPSTPSLTEPAAPEAAPQAVPDESEPPARVPVPTEPSSEPETQAADVPTDPPPAGPPSNDPPPATVPASPSVDPLPQEPAADGTTSVVVPQTPGAASPAPAAPSSLPPPTATGLTPVNQLPPTQQAGPPPPAVGLPPPVAPVSPPPSEQPPPQSDAANLLAQLLEPLAAGPGRPLTPADTLLYARPLPLLEPLVRSGDRARRLWIVQAYWKVAIRYAHLRAATAAVERLELVAPGSDPHDRVTLDVATAAALADLADARAALSVAQQELVDLARMPITEPLPWPVDRPLADPYQTHFEAIFANRVATGRVRAIVRSLPARHEALAARAAAVRAAEKAVTMAEADHARANRPIEAVITAHQALVGQQQAFLEAIETYNLDIAEYAMAVATLTLPEDQFVSMLIGTPIQWRPPTLE
ncbi:MAG: hypothetical protein O3C39_13205 [Planctomycetota bacterium]|jgi:hypothetical protein|nr:hypothetical protein [Planctomycetota bacterium]MDA1202625.1 hypothetical protein [Planctomycetota bacterium]